MRSRLSYSLGDFTAEITRLLSPVCDDFAESEAFTITEHLLELSYSEIIRNRSRIIDRSTLEQAQAIITERLTGKPLPYILGKTYFYSKEFALSSETLIPRPDTEHLVQAVLDGESVEPKLILELGTGSGIIPEILTSERSNWRVVTTDICEETIITAKSNFSSDRIIPILCDRFESITPAHQFDCIVSNPPYIPHSVCLELDSSVKEFEPLRALDGGIDGLDFYRSLAETAHAFLKPGGKIYLEIGYDQGESVPALLHEFGFSEVQVRKDFGGNDRVVIGYTKKLP